MGKGDSSTQTQSAKTILIVDDERSLRFSIGEWARDAGFHPLEAASGREALERLRDQDVDAVVLDLKLADEDGIQVLRRVRELDATLPVIMLTGHGTIEHAVRATRLGAYDFMLKPPDLEHLEVVLRRAVQRVGVVRFNPFPDAGGDQSFAVALLDAEGTGLVIFERKAPSDAKEPLRTITGSNTMLVQVMRTRVHNGWIIAGNDGIQSERRNGLSFIGVWSIYDDGNVAPRWTIGGPQRMIQKPRGLDIDVKNQTVIVSDKDLNGVLTYHVPEIFRESPTPLRTGIGRDATVAAGRN